MDGLREQRSDSSNNQRDNLLNSLHECDTYKELSKKRRDPEDITSFQQIELKKSSLDDIHNFYSRLEEGFENPESLINGYTREVTEKYDALVEQAFKEYGMDREFILTHRYDIRARIQSHGTNDETIEFIFLPASIKLFSINRGYRFVDYPPRAKNGSFVTEMEGYLQLFMNYEGTEKEALIVHQEF